MSKSIIDACGHIKWTLERSPSSYPLCREMLMDLRQQLVNCELVFMEDKLTKKEKKHA